MSDLMMVAAFRAAWQDACLWVAEHELDCNDGCPDRPCPERAFRQAHADRHWNRYAESRDVAAVGATP